MIQVDFFAGDNDRAFLSLFREIRPRENEWLRIGGKLYRIHSIVSNAEGDRLEVRLIAGPTKVRADG